MNIDKITKGHTSCIRDVNNWLKHDFPKYQMIANASNGLKSPQMSFAAVDHTNYTDGLEKMMMRVNEAINIVKSVNEAIELLPSQRLKTIMINFYLKHQSCYAIQATVHVERSQFFTLKRYALYCFANFFLLRQMANNIDHPIDLT